MSEYNSLYIKIKIKEEKLQQFFQASPVPQHIDENWLAWWNSRETYSKEPLEGVLPYPLQSNRAIFDQLLKSSDFGAQEYYDVDKETWTFITIFFSENYIEILPMLALLKDLASYMKPESKGHTFIYDFCWDYEQVMAYLEFSNQEATFKNYTSTTEIDAVILEEANHTLETAMDQFSR